MYLAEDRILCLEIYSWLGKDYYLKYIPNAKAVVDPVTSLHDMLGQRKRWINGSWFALDYVLEHYS
jgi:chitin synthase